MPLGLSVGRDPFERNPAIISIFMRSPCSVRVKGKAQGKKIREHFGISKCMDSLPQYDARKLQGYLDQQDTCPTERRKKGHVIPLRQVKNE
jgi:hypothetical protein